MKIFIIAEIGINHNGDINIAKDLIDVAIKSGANAVKFQKRDIDLVYTKDFLSSKRDSPWGETQRDQKKGLEFEKEEYDFINEYCNKNDIEWFASAWDINSLEFINRYNLKYNKIASAMIVDETFLRKVSQYKKHTFISTGMSNEKIISKAVEIFRDNNCSFELMHTVSTYPMKPEHANLKTINYLQRKYNCDVGYSGHETGVAISVGAAALGITSLERHITLDRSMYGSDQSASLEPRGLTELIGSVRKVESALGEENKIFIEEEKPIANKLREHLNWSI